MERRIDYRRRLENNRRKKKLARVSILSAFGVIGAISSVPALASEWTANAPESIQIEQGATSYTMKEGDTLWAIGVKINVNVNTLASVNNIDLDSGEQFALQVGTVIHFSESEIKATNSNGQSVNEGVKVNDSNKIVADKPIGTDVSKEVSNGNASNSNVVGQPDNTGNLPNPNTGGNTSNGGNNSNNGNSGSNSNNGGSNGSGNTNNNGNGSNGNGGNSDNGGDNGSNNGNNGGDNGSEKPVDPEKPVNPTDPTNVDKFVTINVDEDGNVLESTEGYNFVSETTKKSVVKDEKGNSVTTYTTTKVWTKEGVKPTEPTNKDVFITVNVDTNGTPLSSTEGYSFVSESTDEGVVVTLGNGDTETTYTTTRVWEKDHVPINEDKYVTVNVDTNGAFLSSTDGYTYVSENTTSSIQTLENGDTITTYTTTVVWKKNAPVEVVPVTPLGNSGILTPDLGQAGAQGEAMHNDPESAYYWAWFAVNEGSDDKVWAWKTITVTMSDGSTWYSVEFYVDYI